MKPRRISGHVEFVASGFTDVGRVREHNEDSILVREDLCLAVVCDGMGGHGSGEIGSRLAAMSIENFFEASIENHDLISVADVFAPLPLPARRLVAAIRKANKDVHAISRTVSKHKGMGSTVVGLCLGDDDMLHVAHVGDSRCYRMREGVLQQLTRDHSLINEALAMKPDLTPAELAQFPKNIVTRGLGMSAEVQVDIQSHEVMSGDVFLLCSDGLSGMVPDDSLREFLEFTEDLKEGCELLVAEANNNGGTDNISAILVRVTKAAEAPEILAEEVPEEHPPSIEFEPTFPAFDRSRCGYCGFKIEVYQNFCVECGAKITQGT